MSTLGGEVFLREPAYSDLGFDVLVVPGNGDSLDDIYSADASIVSLIVTTINGLPYPPPVVPVLIDTTTEIVDAGDNTISVTFDADGAPGTDAQMRFTQTASRDYGFPDIGVDSTVITTEGAQTISGPKTITDTSLVIQSSGDPTTQLRLDAAGIAGTSGTVRFAQTANRLYTVPDSAVDTEILLVEGNQTISGTKLFTNLRIVDIVNPTIALELSASGAAGTTGTLRFTQAANRQYNLPPVGSNTDILVADGAQIVTGAKSFSQLTIVDAVDATRTLQLSPAIGSAQTTFRFAQAANRSWTYPDVPVASTNVILLNATTSQAFTDAKTFSAGIFTDFINERTLNNGVSIDGMNFRIFNVGGVDVAQLAAVGADANIEMIFRAAGQITTIVPDNGIIAGNVRGADSTDFQRDRLGLATAVASGASSGLFVGRGNRAGAINAAAFCGTTNLADRNSSVIGGGIGNLIQINGIDSFILSGNASLVRNGSSAVAGGTNHDIDSTSSFVGGGDGASIIGNESVALTPTAGANIVTARAFVGSGAGGIIDGALSSIGTGLGNTNNAATSCILTGSSCILDGSTSAILNGALHNVTATLVNDSVILGGDSHVNGALGISSAGFIGGGTNCNLSDTYTVATAICSNGVDIGGGPDIHALTCDSTPLGQGTRVFAQGNSISSNVSTNVALFGSSQSVSSSTSKYLFGDNIDAINADSNVLCINATSAPITAPVLTDGIWLNADEYFIASANDGTGTILLTDAIDDVAAGVAGVLVGEVYRTGSVLKVRVV